MTLVLHQQINMKLSLNLASEVLLGIDLPPPDTCPVNDQLISSINDAISEIQSSASDVFEGNDPSNEWIDYDEAAAEDFMNRCYILDIWHDGWIEFVEDLHSNEPIERYEELMQGIQHVFGHHQVEKTKSPEVALDEICHQIQSAQKDFGSTASRASFYLKRLRDELECAESELKDLEDEEDIKITNAEVEKAQNAFDELRSDLSREMETYADDLENAKGELDQVLRRRCESFRRATIDLKTLIKDHLPEKLLEQPHGRLRDRMAHYSNIDKTITVATLENLRRKMLESHKIICAATPDEVIIMKTEDHPDLEKTAWKLLKNEWPELKAIAYYDTLGDALQDSKHFTIINDKMLSRKQEFSSELLKIA